MNGHVLAYDITVADFDRAASPGLETEILRRAADDRAVSDVIIRAQTDGTFDHGMRLDNGARSDFHFTTDAGKGSDLDAVMKTRAWVDNSRRVNFHSTPVSLKLK
jgi:hypothetical protein